MDTYLDVEDKDVGSRNGKDGPEPVDEVVIQSGQEGAFSHVVESHGDTVVQHFLRHVPDNQFAVPDNLIQSVCVKRKMEIFAGF